MNGDHYKDFFEALAESNKISRRSFLSGMGRAGVGVWLLGGLGGMIPWRSARAASVGEAAYPVPKLLYPGHFAPALAAPGEPLRAEVSMPASAGVAAARLVPASGAPVILKSELSKNDAVSGAFEFMLYPESKPAPGGYSLEITLKLPDGDKAFSKPNSVWIADAFPESFTFGIVSDYHVGDNRGKRIAPKLDFTKLRARILEELDALKPAFVLVTGDVVYQPGQYANDYETLKKEFLQSIHAPVFAAPGNHDIYKIKIGDVWNIEGRDFWRDYMGPLTQTFDYGRHRFIGMNTFDRSPDARDMTKIANAGSPQKLSATAQGGVTPSQLQWLESELKRASAEDKITTVFGHHSPIDNIDAVDNITGEQLADPADMIRIMKDNGVSRYFYGHKHVVREDTRDPLMLKCTGTSGSDLGDEHGWGFRVVDVRGGRFESRYIEVEKHP